MLASAPEETGKSTDFAWDFPYSIEKCGHGSHFILIYSNHIQPDSACRRHVASACHNTLQIIKSKSWNTIRSFIRSKKHCGKCMPRYIANHQIKIMKYHPFIHSFKKIQDFNISIRYPVDPSGTPGNAAPTSWLSLKGCCNISQQRYWGSSLLLTVNELAMIWNYPNTFFSGLKTVLESASLAEINAWKSPHYFSMQVSITGGTPQMEKSTLFLYGGFHELGVPPKSF